MYFYLTAKFMEYDLDNSGDIGMLNMFGHLICFTHHFDVLKSLEKHGHSQLYIKNVKTITKVFYMHVL